MPERLSPAALRDHLAAETGEVCGIVRQLRRKIIAVVPEATEAIKFRAISYFFGDAAFGSIGGNICMIETRDEQVRLSFIHGATLTDPHGLLRGAGKAKRYVPIVSREAAADPRLAELVRESAAQEPQF